MFELREDEQEQQSPPPEEGGRRRARRALSCGERALTDHPVSAPQAPTGTIPICGGAIDSPRERPRPSSQ